MKKKLFSRSLALGALMAFVITGSAFAAVEESGTIIADKESISKSFDVLHVIGEPYQGAVLGAGAFNNYTLELTGNELTIKSVGVNSVTGVVVNEGTVKANSDKVNVSAAASNDACGLFISAEDKNGNIYIGGEDSVVNISAKGDSSAIGIWGYGAYENENIRAKAEINGSIINIHAYAEASGAKGIAAEYATDIAVGSESSTVQISAAGSQTGLGKDDTGGIYANGDGRDAAIKINGSVISVASMAAAGDAYGVLAEDGGNVVLGNTRSEVTINVVESGAVDSPQGNGNMDAAGIIVRKDSQVTLDGSSIKIDADSTAAYAVGMAADNGGKISLGNEESEIRISAEQKDVTAASEKLENMGAMGVFARADENYAGEASEVSVSGKLIDIAAVTSSGDAFGVGAENGGVIFLGAENSAVTIRSEGDWAVGVQTYNEQENSDKETAIHLNGSSINVDAAAKNDMGLGVIAVSGSSITMGSDKTAAQIDVSSETAAAYAVWADGAGIEINGSSVKLTANSGTDEACGVKASEEADMVLGSENAQVVISAQGNEASGIQVSDAAKTVVYGGKLKIEAEASGGNAYGVYAFGENSSAVLGDGSGDISITAAGTRRTAGIDAEGEAVVEVKAKAVDITAEGAADNGYGIIANGDGSKVSVTADAVTIDANAVGLAAILGGSMAITGDTAVTAPEAVNISGSSVLRLNNDGQHSTVLNGDIAFKNADAADVQIGLNGAASSWTGASVGGVQGFMLNINGGAVWNVTGDSVVNDLILYGGVVNLQKGSAVVDSLQCSEGAVSVANADNKFTVTGSSSIEKLTATASQEYAEALASDDMAGAAQSVANQVVDENAKTIATDVYIPESTVVGAYTAEVNAEGKVINGRESLNSANAGIGNLAGLALMAWRAENNDMNKRLGELRASEGEHGVWVRMTRGESKYKGVKNQYNSYQIGYDEKLSSDKHWTLGAAFSYTDGESGLSVGSGENKHKGLALYGSYLGDDGSFIDLIAKYARLEHEFDIRGGAGSGAYDTNGYSLSAEYGKRFTQANGVWLEPQAELTYGHMSGANYLSSNGARVRQDAMDSVVGRLGFALGQNIKQGNVYARVSYLYDFDGDASVSFAKNGAERSIGQDLGGGWWEVGVGANLKLGKDTHFYVDVEKTYGGDVSTPWQWNAGMRLSF